MEGKDTGGKTLLAAPARFDERDVHEDPSLCTNTNLGCSEDLKEH